MAMICLGINIVKMIFLAWFCRGNPGLNLHCFRIFMFVYYKYPSVRLADILRVAEKLNCYFWPESLSDGPSACLCAEYPPWAFLY